MSRRGVTLQDVARACGVAVSTVGAWSQAKNWPQVEVQPKLAKYLHSSIAFLIHGITEEPELPAEKTEVPQAADTPPLVVNEGPQAPYGSAEAIERDLRKHFEEVLQDARGDPVRLGWMMQQLIEHLSPPKSWAVTKAALASGKSVLLHGDYQQGKSALVPASANALTTRAQTELLSSETGKPIPAAQPSRRARPA